MNGDATKWTGCRRFLEGWEVLYIPLYRHSVACFERVEAGVGGIIDVYGSVS